VQDPKRVKKRGESLKRDTDPLVDKEPIKTANLRQTDLAKELGSRQYAHDALTLKPTSNNLDHIDGLLMQASGGSQDGTEKVKEYFRRKLIDEDIVIPDDVSRTSSQKRAVEKLDAAREAQSSNAS